MSNERRHELETNDLAILLDRVNKAVEPYSKLIALGIGAAFLGVMGWLFYSSQQTGQRSDSTLDLIQATASQDPEVLMEVSQDYPGTTAAAWAQVYQGQLQLSQGIQTLYRDREEAEQLLNDAKSALQSAVAGSSDQLLRSRAYLGIARAQESLGNLEEAIAAYQEVSAIGESDAIIKHADQQIAALGDPKTKEFLTWFDDQEFAPSDPSLPPSLPGVGSLPDLPDLKLTELPGGEAKDEEMELEDEPAEDSEGDTVEEAADDSSAEEAADSAASAAGDSEDSSTDSEDPEGDE
jgi:tetratricopeptide (TPR) repeat protein